MLCWCFQEDEDENYEYLIELIGRTGHKLVNSFGEWIDLTTFNLPLFSIKYVPTNIHEKNYGKHVSVFFDKVLIEPSDIEESMNSQLPQFTNKSQRQTYDIPERQIHYSSSSPTKESSDSGKYRSERLNNISTPLIQPIKQPSFTQNFTKTSEKILNSFSEIKTIKTIKNFENDEDKSKKNSTLPIQVDRYIPFTAKISSLPRQAYSTPIKQSPLSTK